MASYQYGTSPRKFESDYRSRKNDGHIRVVKDSLRQNVRISTAQRKKNLKIFSWALFAIVILMTISFRNSQIDKEFNQIQSQKKELASLQKENEQLKVSIENSTNLSNIEKVAKEELGMQKLSQSQTVYVTLPKKDYVEPATEKVNTEEKQSIWDKILDKIYKIN